MTTTELFHQTAHRLNADTMRASMSRAEALREAVRSWLSFRTQPKAAKRMSA